MLAADLGSPQDICRPPAIAEIIEPDRRHIPLYRDKHAQFQRLYAQLRDEFQS
jgi:hypothetical protein